MFGLYHHQMRPIDNMWFDHRMNPYQYGMNLPHYYHPNHFGHYDNGASYQPNFHPYTHGYNPNYFNQFNFPSQENMSMQSDNHIQSLFQNPLQPHHEQQYYPSQQSVHPYPKINVVQKPSGGLHSVMNSFKGQDGTIDFNKMMNTAGNMMNAVSQVSSVVKGFSSIFKV